MKNLTDMSNKILLKFAKKGINLSPDAYNKIMASENPLNLASSLIVKLKSNKYKPQDLISVKSEVVDELMGTSKPKKDDDNKKPIENKSESSKETSTENKKEKKDPDNTEKVIDSKIEFKRNSEKINVEYDFEVIQDSSNKSYTSGEIGDLIAYFQSRYEKLSKILKHRPELKATTKVADIENGQSNLSMILMVKEIRSTKNGHKLVEFEDETGSISILFSNKNEELFADVEKLVKDEVVGVIATKNDDLAIANQLIYPGVTKVAQKEMDFGVVFLSEV